MRAKNRVPPRAVSPPIVALVLGVLGVFFVGTSIVTAQARGNPPRRGNPTPGTTQPVPPNLADRVTFIGCLQAATPAGTAPQTGAAASEPSDARFLLTKATREARVPAGGGTSPAAVAATGDTFRLAAIDSALSPFVGAKVEVSGQIEPTAPDAAQKDDAKPPVLRVEFVQKLAARCS
jgi:hypothetical protein